jgi:hypothetical protein
MMRTGGDPVISGVKGANCGSLTFPLRIEFHRNAARITKVTDGGSGYMPIISPVKIKPPAPKGDSGNRRSASGQVA